MLKWGWDTKKTELVNLTRFGCITLYETAISYLPKAKFGINKVLIDQSILRFNNEFNVVYTNL